MGWTQVQAQAINARAGRVQGAVARVTVVLAAVGVIGGAVVACGPTTAAPPPPSSVTPGSVRIDGVVRQPATLDPAALAGMPQADVTVTFQSGQGPQTHQERGVPLATLLPPASLSTRTDRKNDQLSFGVLAVGADGYQALLSYGEVSPDVGHRDPLLSLVEDGRSLPRPRLVVPGDAKGGRYVSDLVELRVVRP